MGLHLLEPTLLLRRTRRRIYPKEPSDTIESLDSASDMVQGIAPYLQLDGSFHTPEVMK